MQEAQAYSATMMQDPNAFNDNYRESYEEAEVVREEPKRKESRFI